MRRVLGVSRATVIVASLGLCVLTTGWYTLTQPAGEVNVWALSVGRGSAVLVETPEGRGILINAGSLSRGGLGRRVVEPFLRTQGRKNLERVLVTQAADPCINGLPGVLENVPAGGILCGIADGTRIDNPAVGRLQGMATDHRLPIELLVAGDRVELGRGALIEVLWPPRRPMLTVSPSQLGLILRLTYGRQAILFVGAQQEMGLEAILKADEKVACDTVICTNGLPNPRMRMLLALTRATRIICPRVDDAAIEEEPEEIATAGYYSLREYGCIHLRMQEASVEMTGYRKAIAEEAENPLNQ